MFKRIGSLLLMMSLLFSMTQIIMADARPYVIDRNHSQINFVGEARFISAHGFFESWEAEVRLDPQDFEKSAVNISIDATSINTRVAPRDNHLRSKDFLAVEQYSKIIFVSKKVSKAGEKKYNVLGDLTLRGVTREIEVPLTMVFYDNNRGRFRGTFEINRRDFGMTYNSKLNPVEDMVQVQVDINVLDKEAMDKARADAEKAKAAKPN